MTALLEISGRGPAVLGGTFGLIGSFGLLKDPMQRLHPAHQGHHDRRRCRAGGLRPFLLTAPASAHEIRVTLFLFLTAPPALFSAVIYLLRSLTRKVSP